MKYDMEFIKQLLIKHGNNKSAVAREIGMDRANLNRHLRKMHVAGMVDENYNVCFQVITDEKLYDELIRIVGVNRIQMEENSFTCYIIENDDKNKSISELEEEYGGFND